jgi:hypothetical protein
MAARLTGSNLGRVTGGGLLKGGIAAIVLAVLGWVLTFVAGTFLAQPDTIEDLTPAWAAAGATPLGDSRMVVVPPGQTLVAFLVGTDLLGSAGTTTGSCSATTAGRPIDLSWPVQINPELSGILGNGQQVVGVAGWTNHDRTNVTVEITCDSGDSTVEHFVAIPTHTGALSWDPWFQPWGWLALGTLGFLACALGVARAR